MSKNMSESLHCILLPGTGGLYALCRGAPEPLFQKVLSPFPPPPGLCTGRKGAFRPRPGVDVLESDATCGLADAGDLAGPGLDKANYIGNKRRLAKYIVDKFPKGAKTLYDPMCGCSAVPIEAARRGMRVVANDLSLVPYWYSKGVFEGAVLSEDDLQKLLEAPAKDGWLTTEWEGMYPRPKAVRRYLDGLAKEVREFQGPKCWAAKAVLSTLLQRMYAESGSGYSTRKYETVPAVRKLLAGAAKEINGLVAEVGGKGKVTHEDARQASFPKADLVYFDPPYFKRDKGILHYFQTYRIMNSILAQKAWHEENLTPEHIPALLEKLCKGSGHVFVSTSASEVVPYARELGRHKGAVKRYQVTYVQPSGFGSRDAEQHQNLYVAKAQHLGEEPFLDLSQEAVPHRYVVQEHFRGRSYHADLRYEAPGRESLIGWTLATAPPEGLASPVTTLEEAAQATTPSRIAWESGAFVMGGQNGEARPVEIVALPKDPHGLEWLDFEGVVDAPEEDQLPAPGATPNFPGVFRIVDQGLIEYGAQREGFHEYFLASARETGGLMGRLSFRRLPVQEGRDEIWLLAKPEEQIPYVLSDLAVSDGWVPPVAFSALPLAVRAVVPPDLRYWEFLGEAERLKRRDALVAALKAGEVSLDAVAKGEGADGEDFEKRKLVPFNQWGGSAKYAKRLAERFPEHGRYVETFAGSAAVLYAKDRVGEEILGDADPNVIFAHRYIQRLDKASFATLKRFPWKVSRAGFKKVRESKPRSDSERFWKLVYGRACSWGGRPNLSGYSTLHDGNTYGLEDLWRFQERLKGVRLVTQDWKKTLARCDSADTLFFIDPPYIKEWGDLGDEISPEDIADGVRKLKGDFVIAYTDSARARRALSKVGHPFRLKIQEARHTGIWAKRNRLFVASFDLKKSEELEFVEPHEIEDLDESGKQGEPAEPREPDPAGSENKLKGAAA